MLSISVKLRITTRSLYCDFPPFPDPGGGGTLSVYASIVAVILNLSSRPLFLFYWGHMGEWLFQPLLM